MVAPTVGALLAGMFNYPEYLGTNLALTFGRLRPVHWCQDGEGGGIVDGSRLNTRPIALAYAVRKRKWHLRHSSI